MKTIQRFMLLVGILALAGCSSTPQGGTVDQEEYDYNNYNSVNPNVPGRPDGIHTYPSDNFPTYPMMPSGDRW
jgi:hypothetical protein